MVEVKKVTIRLKEEDLLLIAILKKLGFTTTDAIRFSLNFLKIFISQMPKSNEMEELQDLFVKTLSSMSDKNI